MTPVFSWSECVISRVLCCFYFLQGGLPFLCFVCVSSSCLAERWYFWSFGLVLSGLGLVVCVCYVLFFGVKVVEFCCCDTWMSTTVMRMMM